MKLIKCVICILRISGAVACNDDAIDTSLGADDDTDTADGNQCMVNTDKAGLDTVQCPGGDVAAVNDPDGDGIADVDDVCLKNAGNDPDNDGICAAEDMCVGDNSMGDLDSAGVCDAPIYLVGQTEPISRTTFIADIEASGFTMVDSNEVSPGECAVMYDNAGAEETVASAESGLLTCAVDAFDNAGNAVIDGVKTVGDAFSTATDTIGGVFSDGYDAVSGIIEASAAFSAFNPCFGQGGPP